MFHGLIIGELDLPMQTQNAVSGGKVVTRV
jgi:hypothetical protein